MLHWRNMTFALPDLLGRSRDCADSVSILIVLVLSLSHAGIASISIFRVVLLGFVTIDRLFLCSLVQVESNMQYVQRWESELHDGCELQCLAMAFTIMRLHTAKI